MVKGVHIEGYAIVSCEGMIAAADGSFPEQIKVPADHDFYQASVDRAAAVCNGRHSAEGGPKERERKRIVLTRRIHGVAPYPGNSRAILWNPASASLEEALSRLGIEAGTLAVVGGTDVFALFLNIGYDVFYLSRTDASVPGGRPVFPGVGPGRGPEEVMLKHGLVLRDTRMLDPATNTRVEEWGHR